MSSAYPSLIELPALTPLEEWGEPVLFEEIQTPEITADLLPDVLGEFAAALATATETPESLNVMMVLGVVSACVAKRFSISPKPGWLEPIHLYTLIALPSANNKSQVLRACTKPLIDWEQSQRMQLEREIKYQRAERKNQEKRIESLRIKAAKEEDIVKQKQLFQEIIELEVNLIEPAALPVLFVNDATPESLAMTAYAQHGRLAIFSDEGGIFETLAGLYTNGSANIDILLKGIDGGDVRIHRKDQNINLNPFLTLVFAVQPVVLQRLGNKAVYQGNGTLERFLYVLPKSKLGYRTHDKPPVPDPIQQAYQRKIQALLTISPLMQNGGEVSRILKLDSYAHQAWQIFQREVEVQLRPEGRLGVCQGWGGKICGFALRIAGLLHVAKESEQNLVIMKDTMDKALLIAHILIEHAISAFGFMGMDQSTQDAKEIYYWIIANNKPLFSQSEITLAMRNKKFAKADRLSKALTILIERNLLDARRLSTRKPTTIYYVHPAILTPTT